MRTYASNFYYTFGGAQYLLIVPALNQSAPRPRPRTRRQWVEIPYGGNKNENGIGRGPTIWSPAGGILVPDAAYTTFEALYDTSSAALTTPWGTFSAILTQLELTPFNDASWRGAATFEWTTT